MEQVTGAPHGVAFGMEDAGQRMAATEGTDGPDGPPEGAVERTAGAPDALAADAWPGAGDTEAPTESALGWQHRELPPSPSAADEEDPFAGLDADVDEDAFHIDAPDYGAGEFRAPLTAPSPVDGPDTRGTPADAFATPSGAQPPPAVVAQAAPEPKRSRRWRVPARVWSLSSSVAQAAVLVAMLALSVVVARGGAPADLFSARAVDVLLGHTRGAHATESEIVATDVVVQRRSVPGNPNLIVISGYLENRSGRRLSGVRVQAQFPPDERKFLTFAHGELDPISLERANSPREIDELQANSRKDSSLDAGGRAPFTVLASDVPLGARVHLSFAEAQPPSADARQEPPRAPGAWKRKAKPTGSPRREPSR